MIKTKKLKKLILFRVVELVIYYLVFYDIILKKIFDFAWYDHCLIFCVIYFLTYIFQSTTIKNGYSFHFCNKYKEKTIKHVFHRGKLIEHDTSTCCKDHSNERFSINYDNLEVGKYYLGVLSLLHTKKRPLFCFLIYKLT